MVSRECPPRVPFSSPRDTLKPAIIFLMEGHLMEKTLDRKLKRILADPHCRDFILADAKDADMAFGLSATGVKPGGDQSQITYRSLAEYHDCIRQLVTTGLIDVMLMSASTNATLTIDDRIFDSTAVTPAVRMNDTTDIWLAAGSGSYTTQSARPFATTTIPHAMCGHAHFPNGAPLQGADLGLFSITLNDDVIADREMLECYKAFRIDAERCGFRHFLEVFFPNKPAHCDSPAAQHPGRFLADSVVRLLAGVPKASRPIFLKIPYLGPRLTEMLAAYDRSMVIGILGGSSGTTLDAFSLLADAKRYGARIALFGRKINAAEDQVSFVKILREVADEQIEPREGVRAYHNELAKLKIKSHRSLEADLETELTRASYG